jgi:hypothetical protein
LDIDPHPWRRRFNWQKKLVPQRAEMANRVRGTNQHSQTAARSALVIKGFDGMQRWVGFGVIADNLINVDRALHERS